MARDYQPATVLARVAIVFLGLSCLVAVAGLVLNYLTLRILLDLEGGFARQLVDLDRLETAQVAVNGLSLLVLIAAAVPFLIWIHQASGNARALGIDNLPTSPGFAVGYWFIPVLNLIMPPKIIGDLWRASAVEAEPEAWQDAEVPSWIIVWWLLFLMAHFIGMATAALESRAVDLAGVKLLIWGDLTRGLCWIAAGILAILIVREIDWRQSQRASARSISSGSDVLDTGPASPQIGD